MRAPAEFIVLRHLLTHPEDSPANIQRHTGLRIDSASKALQRIRHDQTWSPRQLLERARTRSPKIQRRQLHFYLPDPKQWLKAAKLPHLVSGELAAAEADKLNLRPSTLLVYIPIDHLTAAARVALDLGAEAAHRRDANLTLREADAWLTNDDDDEHLAEKGQRLLDYAENPNIQLLRGLSQA